MFHRALSRNNNQMSALNATWRQNWCIRPGDIEVEQQIVEQRALIIHSENSFIEMNDNKDGIIIQSIFFPIFCDPMKRVLLLGVILNTLCRSAFHGKARPFRGEFPRDNQLAKVSGAAGWPFFRKRMEAILTSIACWPKYGRTLSFRKKAIM